MTKREERELFFKAVFITEFTESNEDPRDRVNNFLIGENMEEYSQEFIPRIDRFLEALPGIDDIINDLAEGWKTSRIAKVDLALLRVAIFEMKSEGLAKSIAINEAVELAKEYGEDRSFAFINGILGKVKV